MAKPVNKAKTQNPKQEARSPETSVARLQALAKESTELARLVAQNASCPEDLLCSLARHTDAGVRKRVVSNPQTPVDVAVALGSQFPLQLADNPAFVVYLLERPNLVEGIGATALRSLVKRDVCPTGLLEYAAGIDDEAMQLSALTNAATPAAAVEKLKKSAHAVVRDAAVWHVSAHPKPSGDWRTFFHISLGESLKSERPNAALNSLAHVIAHSLALQGQVSARTDEETDILNFKAVGEYWYFGRNPSMPKSILERLAEDTDFEVRAVVASNPSTPATVLEQLANDKTLEVSQRVGGNKSTPAAVIEQLANDQQYDVYSSVTRNPLTPAAVLERLAMHEFWDVRRSVATNPSTSSEVLGQLASDQNNKVRNSAAENPSTPTAILERLERVERGNIRSSVLKNPSMPAAVLEQQAANEDKEVRSSVAKNPSTPAVLLERLAVEKTLSVCCSIANNPSTPTATLGQIARDQRKDIRSSVAKNPSTPAEILEQLARDKSINVRESVGGNPSTPAVTLERIARDKREDIRSSVAKNPSTPAEILEQLARDKNINVRESVAKNPSTPPEVLEYLAEDNGRTQTSPMYLVNRTLMRSKRPSMSIVRWAVAYNPSISSEFLERLFLSSTDVSDEFKKRVNKCLKAEHPLSKLAKLRAEFLEKLTSATRPSVSRLLGLRLPDCPVSSLAMAQRSTDWRERCAIASNPNTSPLVLERLAGDANVFVRYAVEERLRSPDQ